MTVDEFEALRLLDDEGLTQEACASRMNIARTTVTAIYDSARKKVADALVNGKRLLITGGHCEFEPVEIYQEIIEKGTHTMRIAVTYENGEIFQHFGHTEQFKLYDVEEGKIVNEQIVDTNGSGHGALAGFLKAVKADALICGGIGMGAQTALADAGIKLYAGVQGSADAAAKSLAEGTLEYDQDAKCDHHGHHHGEGHECGHHHGEGHDCGHHHGENHECGHHHGKGLDCGHEEGDEGCAAITASKTAARSAK
jgi:predicted Fe-Mo cluster-binding NifX family protein